MTRAKIVTHYDNLKVARNAPVEVIRAAYRALAQQFHPDKFSDRTLAEHRMKIINRAYEVLSDVEKRLEHDAWILEQQPSLQNAEDHGAAETVLRESRTARSDVASGGPEPIQAKAKNVPSTGAGSSNGYDAGVALRRRFLSLNSGRGLQRVVTVVAAVMFSLAAIYDLLVSFAPEVDKSSALIAAFAMGTLMWQTLSCYQHDATITDHFDRRPIFAALAYSWGALVFAAGGAMWPIYVGSYWKSGAFAYGLCVTAIWLIPVAVIFGIGCLLRWVGRGFTSH